MSARSLNGLNGVNNYSVVITNRMVATLPIEQTQASFTDPILIGLKGISGLGLASQVMKMNAGATALEWATDENTEYTVTSPLDLTGTVISLKDINGYGTAGQVLKTNGTTDGLVWADDDDTVISVTSPLDLTGTTVSLKDITGYTGSAGDILASNGTNDGLIWRNPVTGSSNWVLNSSDLYPLATATNVVIGNTTNTNNDKLLVDGDADITGNLYLNSRDNYLDSNSNNNRYYAGYTAGATGSQHLFYIKNSAGAMVEAGSLNFGKITSIGNANIDGGNVQLFLYSATGQNIKIKQNEGGGVGGNPFTSFEAWNDSDPSTSEQYYKFMIEGSEYLRLTNTGITVGEWKGTTIATAYGGTGITGYVDGDMLYSSGTTLTKLAIGSTSEVLKVVAGVPTWGAETDTTYTCTSPLDLTGTVISLKDITGYGTANQVLRVNGTTDGLVWGDAPILSGGGVVDITGTTITLKDIASYSGSAGDVLASNGTNNGLIWTTPASAFDPTTANNFGTAATGAISVGNSAGSAATAPLNFYTSGTTIYNTSNVAVATFSPVSNTLDVDLNSGNITTATMGLNTVWNGGVISQLYGGTGLSSYTAGDLIFANALSTLTTLPISGSAGKYLKSDGSTVSWETQSGSTYSGTSPIDVTGTVISLKDITGYTGSAGDMLCSNGTNNGMVWTTPSSLWTQSGSDIYYNSGDVIIGGTTMTDAAYTTDLNGSTYVKNGTLALSLGEYLTWNSATGTVGGAAINGNATSNQLTFYTSSTMNMSLESTGDLKMAVGKNLRLATPPSGVGSTQSDMGKISFDDSDTMYLSGQWETSSDSVGQDAVWKVTGGDWRLFRGTVPNSNASNYQCLLFINPSSTFYIYAGSGAQNIYLSSTTFSGTLSYSGTSDDRVKSDEKTIENATDTLMKLDPLTFMRQKHMGTEEIPKAQTHDTTTKWLESGLIAQEVYYKVPELRHIVSTGVEVEGGEIKELEDGKSWEDIRNNYTDYGWGTEAAGLKYSEFIPYLIKSNQEQQEEINTLKTENTGLKDIINKLINAKSFADFKKSVA